MKWSFATIGLVAAGLVGIVIILLFQNLTVNNEEDYYLLKEITEAAMVDAIDLAYYRDTGKLKIVQEKFVENFTRRFAESANILNTQNYSLEFYNIMEYPPKVSVSVKTDIGEYTIFGNHLETQSYSVANSLDAILEIEEIPDDIVERKKCNATKEYYSIPYVEYRNTLYDLKLEKAPIIKPPDDEGDWEAIGISKKGLIINAAQIQYYMDHYDEMYETERGDWVAIDPELSDYISTNNNVEQLKVFEVDGKTKVWWKSTYYCEKGKKFLLQSGRYHPYEQCIIGIIYEVDWHNKDAKCN